jgi:Tfp pilus assembly protein PilF
MRALTDQIADRHPRDRAIRARRFGVLALLLLVSPLVGCGGSSPSLQDDPASQPQRSRESWESELSSVRAQMSATPQEAYWPYREAEIQLALGASPEAYAALQRSLDIDADFSPALLLLSKLQYQTERYEEAVSMLEAALSRGNEHADDLRMALALHLEALGELESAQRMLDQCTQDPSALRGVETYMSLRGDHYYESLAIAEAALQADPSSASNHNNYGIALLYDGRPEGAREAFLRALELDPQLSGALYNLAIVETYYFYDLEKGRAWFERYAQFENEDPDELGAVFGVDLATRIPASPGSLVEPHPSPQELRDAQ